MTHDDLRKRWKAYWAAGKRETAAWEASGHATAYPHHAPFPDELRGLTCGAKTRAGTPCKRIDLHGNGRCKFHGGASTGPKTDEGRARARRNLAKRWADDPKPM